MTPHDESPKRRPGQRKGATATAPGDAVIDERRARVARLLVAQVPRRRIAEIVGTSLPTVDRDIAAVRALWRNNAAADVADAVGREVAALNEVERRLWAEQLAVQPIDPKAIQSLLQIHDRRARLLGLDRPRKVEVTGPGGAPLVPTPDDYEALLDEIDRLGERLVALPQRAAAPQP